MFLITLRSTLIEVLRISIVRVFVVLGLSSLFFTLYNSVS